MAENVLHEGIVLYNKQNYTGALTFFLALPSDADCDAIDLAYYIGLCYTKLRRYDDAMVYLEQVVTSSSENSTSDDAERVLQCRYVLAVIYCLSGRKRLADFELNKLLEIGYKRSSVYSSLAYVAWEQGEVDKCIDYYNKALAEDDSNATALNGLGYVLANEERDLTMALTYCKKAFNIEGDTAACLDSMGWVYFKMGLFSESRNFLEKAMKADPTSMIIQEHYKIVSEAEE